MHLIPYFGAKDISGITSSEIQAYFKKQKDKFALESLRKHRFCLHSIFEFAVDENMIVKNPVTSRIKLISDIPPIEKKTWTQEEYKAVWEYAKSHQYGAHIMTLMETAITRSELLGLTWRDYDSSNAVLSIKNGLVTARNPYSGQIELIHEGLKNQYRERMIPLSKELNSVIYFKKNETKLKFPNKRIKHIFHAPNGGAYYPDNWYKRVLRMFMKDMHEIYPHIVMLTTHELRHTRASILINSNKNIFSVAELMGHRDLNMLRERYVHLDLDSMRKNLNL